MKSNKRLTALLAAATLVVGGIAVSFADEPEVKPTTTITMTTDTSISSSNFAAYRLLDVTTTKVIEIWVEKVLFAWFKIELLLFLKHLLSNNNLNKYLKQLNLYILKLIYYQLN